MLKVRSFLVVEFQAQPCLKQDFDYQFDKTKKNASNLDLFSKIKVFQRAEEPPYEQ